MSPCSPVPLPSGSPPSLLFPMVFLTVTQCVLESVLRGAALIPRRALTVMGCEVLRVLQLSDTAIIPISHHVPRKVRGSGQGAGGLGDLDVTNHLPVCHQAVEFHEDLFPDTAGCVPASDVHTWWTGSNQQVGPSLVLTPTWFHSVQLCTNLVGPAVPHPHLVYPSRGSFPMCAHTGSLNH